MMISYLEKLRAELVAALALVNVEQAPHLYLRDRLALINGALSSLSEIIASQSFSDSDLMVYHKSVYPSFKVMQLFEIESYYLKSAIPVGDGKAVKRFYREELHCIERFLSRNAAAYEYYAKGAVELDEVYFVVDADGSSALSPVVEFDGADGSTGMAYLFARFLCYERLAEYILGEIEKIDHPGGLGSGSAGAPARTFQWTGETVNLIELAHGVYLDGQLHQSIGIVEFFEGLGEFFGVNLGVPKRGFEDIKRRKRLSKTNFLDRMRKQILDRIDLEDGL
jgi:hypothetical protein